MPARWAVRSGDLHGATPRALCSGTSAAPATSAMNMMKRPGGRTSWLLRGMCRYGSRGCVDSVREDITTATHIQQRSVQAPFWQNLWTSWRALPGCVAVIYRRYRPRRWRYRRRWRPALARPHAAVRCLVVHCSYCCPSSVRLRVRSCHAPRVAGACSVVGGPAAACARCSLSTAWEALLLELWEAA